MTSKDLDYVKDAFNWNLNIYNTIMENIQKVSKNDLKTTLKSTIKLSYNNMKDLIKFLEENNE